jgi:hypothetical protein
MHYNRYRRGVAAYKVGFHALTRGEAEQGAVMEFDVFLSHNSNWEITSGAGSHQDGKTVDHPIVGTDRAVSNPARV